MQGPATQAAGKGSAPRLGRRRAIGLAVVAGACGYTGWMLYAVAPHFDGEALSVTRAHARAVEGSLTLIDIRRPDEWARTGVGEGAHPLDMRRDDFTEALARLVPDRDAPIALICARGVRSARMANRLAEAGFTSVINVPEGMEGSGAGPGWLGTGLPVRIWEQG